MVGHETRHLDDSIGQLQESTRNIRQLLKEAQPPQQPALLKIYLRQVADLAQIDAQISTLFKPEIPRIYLHADICRQDLLLEIDGYSTALSD